ncbi:beta-microseminoprotein [Austrofundulus limnaeus]|uniref:Beta-microseminoprotein n=1 Tax=Austrofundulus limnaeus TaxID=52670 RepID=A0A2I4BIA9_AUSLI|nr:PREDICTED: beta-microseminoprotein [Austrofundulus limnaeus]
MKYLVCALLLCVLVSQTNAYCFFKASTNAQQTHCQDDVDKTWHPAGSSWRNSACMDCSCDSCCSGFSIPRGFPDDCVSVFDPKTCVYIVHKKNNPSELCPIFAAVGR